LTTLSAAEMVESAGRLANPPIVAVRNTAAVALTSVFSCMT